VLPASHPGPPPPRCPYYRFAEAGVFNTLRDANGSAPANASTDYYEGLPTATSVACNASFLAAANSKVRHKGRGWASCGEGL
jgi:hypothetical protein